MTPIANALSSPRAGHSATLVGDDVLVCGGADASGKNVSSCDVLNSATFTPKATVSMADARRGHSASLLETGVVAWGIGMLRDFELGFFGPHGYEKTTFSDRHELLALHGSIALGSEPRFHLHVALGRPDHVAIGGHLFGAKTAVVNEIHMTRFEGIRFGRRLNETTGLRELVFE